MKSILFFVLFILVPKLCVSQINISTEDDAVYLDSLYRMGNEKNYKYIRVVKDYKNLNLKAYEIIDYFKSGKIAMSGTTTNGVKIIKTGTFIYYYENGNKKEIINYKLDKINGNFSTFYKNGNKKEEGENHEDKKSNITIKKINQFWDSNGVQKVVDGNGYYEFIEEYETSKGELKKGYKNGLWEGTLNKSKFSYKETYNDGKLISGITTDTNGNTYPYTELEIKPEPKKGMEDFYNFIAYNYRTPKNQKLNGKVYISFLVDLDGKIIEPKVVRDLGHDTGAEAIRVVTTYEGFVPAEQRGIKTRCSFTIPIEIHNSF
jgi:hypothetical protein